MGRTINIWDSEVITSSEGCSDVLWRSYAERGSATVVSIPSLVEKHSHFLKRRYLAWVFDLGVTVIDGKRVVDHFELCPGFSFWWMSLISSKLNYSASPHITTAIRLLAFDLWARDKDIASVTLITQNGPLAECVEQWCLDREVLFFWRSSSSTAPKVTLGRKIYSRLPNMVKALGQTTRRIWTCWPLRGVGIESWVGSEGEVCFFSYLLNFDTTGDLQGEFRSRFWANLPDELSRNDCKTNWLHLYIGGASRSRAQKAKEELVNFNRMNSGEQVHVALESFLSSSVTLRSLRDWLGLIKLAKMLEPGVSNVDADGVRLWPLFKEEWHSSIIGVSSINAVLNFNLLKAAVSLLPKQRAGVYLYEQQAWELALIHCWRDEGHGLLIGAQHTTMLDWNLRNFHDPRNYETGDTNSLPMPDILALNGPAARETALENEYPEHKLRQVEALRYLYLEDVVTEKGALPLNKRAALRLLVLGDYLESNTKRQMDLLLRALQSFHRVIKITVKPHPACTIDWGGYSDMDLEVKSNPLSDLLCHCDFAYSSPVTSAAVDAYCFGVPVITALDPDALNLSPLRNCNGVRFVSDAEELTRALNSVFSTDARIHQEKDFFTLDSELPRWKALLLEPHSYP